MLNELVRDGCRFVQTFASDIEDHPLCVYLTALPFTPIDTILYQTFVDRDIPWIVSGYNKTWPRLRHTFCASKRDVEFVVFSPDGKLVALSSLCDTTIHVWDVTSGVEVIEPLRGHSNSVCCAAFSNDGWRIVSGSRDNTVRLWNASSGVELLPPLQGHTDAVLSVTFSPCGTQIVSGSVDQTVRLWDAMLGSQLLTPFGVHDGPVLSVTFTIEGQIISSSLDRTVRTVRVWDAATGTQITSSFYGYSVVAVSPDGRFFASSSRCAPIIHVLEAGTGQGLTLLANNGREHLDELAYCLDGTRIASLGPSGVIVWDATNGSQISSIAIVYPWKFALSPNGSQLAVDLRGGTIGLWDAIPGEENVPLSDIPGRFIEMMVFSFDGLQIALCYRRDYSICLWHTHSGLALLAPMQGHIDNVRSVMFSPDGKRLVSGSEDATVRVWDTTSGTEVYTLEGHKGTIYSVTFCPDGSRIVSGSADKTVRLWNATSGTPIFIMRGHIGEVHSATFSADGRQIISCCIPHNGDSDGTIHLWDAMSGTETFRLLVRNIEFSIYSAEISADGQRILASGTDYCADFYGILARDPTGFWMLEQRHKVLQGCNVRDPIIVMSDNWLVDVAHTKVVGKIPFIVSISAFAASQASIAFADRHKNYSIFIMHFPPTSMTSIGTWGTA
jgi:WD40 repeat protein